MKSETVGGCEPEVNKQRLAKPVRLFSLSAIVYGGGDNRGVALTNRLHALPVLQVLERG